MPHIGASQSSERIKSAPAQNRHSYPVAERLLSAQERTPTCAGAVERVIRVVAAKKRVKVTQSAVMRAPSVKTELNALHTEEEEAEAQAAYDHHHPKRPRPP